MRRRKKYPNQRVVDYIHKETGIHPRVINIAIRHFFNGLRSLLSKNEEFHLKGMFKIKLDAHYKRKIEAEGKNINLRPRKHIKRYPKSEK